MKLFTQENLLMEPHNKMARKPKKRMLTIKLKVLRSALHDRLDKVIAYLTSMPQEHPDYTNFHIDTGWDDGEERLFLFGEREETDEEYQKRLEKEKRQEEAQRIRDLELLKALQEKYKDKKLS